MEDVSEILEGAFASTTSVVILIVDVFFRESTCDGVDGELVFDSAMGSSKFAGLWSVLLPRKHNFGIMGCALIVFD